MARPSGRVERRGVAGKRQLHAGGGRQAEQRRPARRGQRRQRLVALEAISCSSRSVLSCGAARVVVNHQQVAIALGRLHHRVVHVERDGAAGSCPRRSAGARSASAGKVSASDGAPRTRSCPGPPPGGCAAVCAPPAACRDLQRLGVDRGLAGRREAGRIRAAVDQVMPSRPPAPGCGAENAGWVTCRSWAARSCASRQRDEVLKPFVSIGAPGEGAGLALARWGSRLCSAPISLPLSGPPRQQIGVRPRSTTRPRSTRGSGARRPRSTAGAR